MRELAQHELEAISGGGINNRGMYVNDSVMVRYRLEGLSLIDQFIRSLGLGGK